MDNFSLINIKIQRNEQGSGKSTAMHNGAVETVEKPCLKRECRSSLWERKLQHVAFIKTRISLVCFVREPWIRRSSERDTRVSVFQRGEIYPREKKIRIQPGVSGNGPSWTTMNRSTQESDCYTETRLHAPWYTYTYDK